MGAQEAGVYWPFKTFLQGSGIVITEDPTSIKIATTGAGPGGGDMLSSVYATNGAPGVVDKALSAQTVTGVVQHAALADSVPWGGIIGAPTIFPTDWGSIANKPATMPPGQHALSHITGGNDVIPLRTTSKSGLGIPLSGRITDYNAGDGSWRDLNTEVGSYPLTMGAALTCNQPVTISAGLGVTGGATISGGVTIQNSSLQVNSGIIQVNCPAGGILGMYNTGANGAYLGLSNGADFGHNACLIYKGSNQSALWETHYNAAGTADYSAEILTTYNPSGAYSFRATTRLIGTCDVVGSQGAWAVAPFLSASQSNGGFAGYGMVSQNFWGCCLGAWQTGLWIATSSNTFVQLTDNSGHIVASALVAGAAQANLGYAPVNRAGDTMSGNLSVSKSAANVTAYQDGNNYVRLQGNLGLYVVSDYNAQGGQIMVQATGGSTIAGITLRTKSGWSYSLWGEDNGTVFIIRNNDGYAKQLLP